MMSRPSMRFGIFLAPFHSLKENPALALERDFELVAHLDNLGFHEAWIGEHHSAGMETIASPEVFIAAALERTRHIRLGTGVSSLPYHHPLLLADRVMQLDYQSRGRFMFGVGPGSLPSDSFMMGLNPLQARDKMDEALSVMVPLLKGETVSYECEWFTLKDARLQLMPNTLPHVEMAVAAQMSPAGPRAAGKYGLGMLSIGATTQSGFMALAEAWRIAEAEALQHGQQVNRDKWRVVGPMHIAETRQQALDDVRFGLNEWCNYFTKVLALPFDIPDDLEGRIKALTESGYAVIGTPEDAINQIERLHQQSGGFGAFLQMAVNWADFQSTKRSYDLMARYVIPHFNGLNTNRKASWEWSEANHDTFIGASKQAKVLAAEKYKKEQQGK